MHDELTPFATEISRIIENTENLEQAILLGLSVTSNADMSINLPFYTSPDWLS